MSMGMRTWPRSTLITPTTCGGKQKGHDDTRASEQGGLTGSYSRNLGFIIAMTAIVCAFHLLAAQYIPAQRSKGDTLQFRWQDARRRPVSPDRENAAPMGSAQDLTNHRGRSERGHDKSETETIQKQTSVFHWSSLSYEVKVRDGPKRILSNIDGWVKPGTLTALMVRIFLLLPPLGTAAGSKRVTNHWSNQLII